MRRSMITLMIVLAPVGVIAGACNANGLIFDRTAPEPTGAGAGASTGGPSTGSAASGGAGAGGAGAGGAGVGGGAGAGGYSCVPAAPAGWVGPFAIHDGPPASAPACGAPYPVLVLSAFADLQRSDALCSACTCTPPSNVTCVPDHIWLHDGSDCSTTLNVLDLGTDGAVCNGNAAVAVDSIRTWGWDAIGTCASGPPQVPVIAPAVWSRAVIGCAAGSVEGSGCGPGEVRVPTPAAPFESATHCVARPGELSCPSPVYRSRRIVHAGVDDTRQCTSCGCRFSGSGCTGTLRGYTGSSCTGQVLTTPAPLACINTTARYFNWTPGSPTNAQCYVEGGDSTGCARPTAPITVCCTGDEELCPPDMVEVPSAGGAYCVDATEVTNLAYEQFLAAAPPLAGQPAECAWNQTYVPSADWPGLPTYPVRQVDWCDAYAYCAWAGKRLCGHINGGPSPFATPDDPAQSQWYSACSQGGALLYAHGNEPKQDACHEESAGADTTVPVRSKPCCEGGYWGLFDMSGNVEEWEDSCDGALGATDDCLVRGGGSSNSSLACASPDARSRDTSDRSIGFRCCAP